MIHRLLWRRAAGFVLAGAVLVSAVGVPLRAQAPAKQPFHVAFTSGMFADVNLNDARAAITVWADSITRARGLSLLPISDVYDDVDRLRAAIDAGRAHLVALSLEEYRRLGRPDFGTILLGQRGTHTAEEILLLVKKGRYSSLADLEGRSMVVLEGVSHHMSLAWIGLTLREAGLADTVAHFGTVMSVAKPARAVLPVFFGQQDAALVDRAAYDLMVELNPQIGRDVVALATSPPMIHSVILFDKRFSMASRPATLDALLALHTTPRGQQLLSLFRLERLTAGTPADLAVSFDILDRLQRPRRAGGKR